LAPLRSLDTFASFHLRRNFPASLAQLAPK